MTDLHFDVKSADFHFEKNKWSVKLTIFVGHGSETEVPFKEEDIHNGYDFAYIPLTLTRCLVVIGAGLIQISLPPHYLDYPDHKYQDIWLSGQEFYFMSMSDYWEQRKKEKLAESRDNEVNS
jgi:hypothetical protein